MSLSPDAASALVEATLYPILQRDYESVPEVGRAMCEVLPWDPRFTYGERLDSITDFGEPDEVPFGTELPERAAVNGWKVYSKTRKIGHKVTIERELFDQLAATGRLGETLEQRFAGQGARFADKIEKHVARYLERGVFTAGDRALYDNSFPGEADPYPLVGYDGVPLFDTDHPLKLSSTTPSNHTVTAVLNATTLDAGRLLMESTSAVDERGERITNRADTLLVPPALETTAIKLVESELQPGSANNDVNANRGRFRVVAWNRLTDSDGWYLARLNSGARSLRMRDSGMPMVNTYYDEKIHSWVIQAFKYYSLTHQDWRGLAAFNKAAS